MQGVMRDILFLLYQQDVVEEEVIMTWYNTVSSTAADIAIRRNIRTQVSILGDRLVEGFIELDVLKEGIFEEGYLEGLYSEEGIYW